MSDINQPCPTICSACKGKCSDQLVLPAGCVLRPTIERVEAVLTPERVDDLYDDALAAWNNDPSALPFDARAISREVVAILAEPPEIDYDKLVRDAWTNHKYRQGTNTCIAFKHGAEWYRHQLATPAASGIGESGGEAA